MNLTNLWPFRNYNVIVKAINGFGAGAGAGAAGSASARTQREDKQ